MCEGYRSEFTGREDAAKVNKCEKDQYVIVFSSIYNYCSVPTKLLPLIYSSSVCVLLQPIVCPDYLGTGKNSAICSRQFSTCIVNGHTTGS